MAEPGNEPEKKRLSARTIALILMKLAISAALLWMLAGKVSFGEAAGHLAKVDWLLAVASFAMLALSLWLSAVRWRSASLGSIPLMASAKLTWIAQLYSMILPGALSADVAKGFVAAGSEKGQTGIGLSVSIVMDRVAGLGVLLVLGALSVLAWPGRFGQPVWVIVVASAAMAAGLAFFPAMCRAIAARFIHSRQSDAESRLARLSRMLGGISPRLWTSLLLQSAAIHLVNITFYWITLAAVGGGESWWRMAVYTCLLNLAMLLPVTIAGIGIREQLSVWLLRSASGHEAIAIAFSWLVLIVSAVHGLIGLLLQWRAWPRMRS